MKVFSVKNERRKTPHKGGRTALLLLPAAAFILSAGACSSRSDPFDSVSELRSNILVGRYNNISLVAHAVERENPYAADGYCREKTPLAEIRLSAPSGLDYGLSFSYGEKDYGGDMSFDNVRAEYFYSCTLDLSEASEITFTVTWEDGSAEIPAATVRTENTLSAKEVLEKVREAESEKFSSMTDRNGFAGEIYLRLIYEDAPYYYVGIIDRNGDILALLVHSESGKILARREM